VARVSESSVTLHDLLIMLVEMRGDQKSLLREFADHKKAANAYSEYHDDRIKSLEDSRSIVYGAATFMSLLAGFVGWLFGQPH